MDPNGPEVAKAIEESSWRIEALRRELLGSFVALRGSMAVAGMFIGHGLASLVANGMTDDQIIANLMVMISGIRREQGKPGGG